jgi:hypothetical protein
MNSVLLTVALLAQQPDRSALEEAREQEAKVRALRKAHLEQAARYGSAAENFKAVNARFEKELLEYLTSSLPRSSDGEKRTICQWIVRSYPQTPLGRFLRLGSLP